MTGMKDHEDEDPGNDHYKQKDGQQKRCQHLAIKFAHTTTPTYAGISLIQTEKRETMIFFCDAENLLSRGGNDPVGNHRIWLIHRRRSGTLTFSNGIGEPGEITRVAARQGYD